MNSQLNIFLFSIVGPSIMEKNQFYMIRAKYYLAWLMGFTVVIFFSLSAFVMMACQSPEKKDDVAAYNIADDKVPIDEMIKKTLDPNWEKNYWFEKVDRKNGYATMGYYGEGQIEYFLFRAVKSDLLVRVEWACGPVCNQSIIFYTFSEGQFNRIKFQALLSPDVLKKLGTKVTDCDVSVEGWGGMWAENSCGLSLEFPQVGAVINIFDSIWRDNNKHEGNKIGAMKWDPNKFTFELI